MFPLRAMLWGIGGTTAAVLAFALPRLAFWLLLRPGGWAVLVLAVLVGAKAWDQAGLPARGAPSAALAETAARPASALPRGQVPDPEVEGAVQGGAALRVFPAPELGGAPEGPPLTSNRPRARPGF